MQLPRTVVAVAAACSLTPTGIVRSAAPDDEVYAASAIADGRIDLRTKGAL